MSRQKNIEKALPDISQYFSNNPKNVYSHHDFENDIELYRELWNIPQRYNSYHFEDFLTQKQILDHIQLKFPNKKYNFFICKNTSIYEIAQSLHKHCYFSHFTAMYLNDLTEQVPRNLYISIEQPRKHHSDIELLQENIDYAFSKPMRRSNNTAQLKDHNITITNTVASNGLGIYRQIFHDYGYLSVTTLERTLLDCTIRPSYSGGCFEILKAYKRAKDKISVAKLLGLYKQLKFIYPYHQAIGFYLEIAGYSDTQIERFYKIPINHNFYLAYDMKNPSYSKKWHLYYPKEMEISYKDLQQNRNKNQNL